MDPNKVELFGARGLAAQILQHIGTRRSRRRLLSDAIDGASIRRIIEASRWAPSCGNNQPWKYYVCTGAEAVKIREALSGGNYWADSAPAYIVAAVDLADSCNLSDGRVYATLDLGLSMQNMFLQAHAEGLAAHPMAGMDPLKVKELLAIGDNYRVMAVISIAKCGGNRELSRKHEESEQAPSPRKPVEEILFNPQVLDGLIQ